MNQLSWVQIPPVTQPGCSAAEARLIWDQKVEVSTTSTPTTGSYVNGRLAVLQTANEGSIPSESTMGNAQGAGRSPKPASQSSSLWFPATESELARGQDWLETNSILRDW